MVHSIRQQQQTTVAAADFDAHDAAEKGQNDTALPEHSPHSNISSKSNGLKTKSKAPRHKNALETFLAAQLKEQFGWIAPKLTWPSWKPVIRSTVAAWISLLLLIIPSSESVLGAASFLILIASLLSPPNEPFVAIVRREINILLAVAIAWAWAVVGLALAGAVRRHTGTENLLATPTAIFAGKYVETAPTAILVTFLALGAGFFLYIKARLGPGPYVYAAIFGCIAIDICFTTGALFPYPYYQIGKTVMLPLACHSAISIACSALICPESVNAQFTKRLVAVLNPLAQAMRAQPEILAKSPLSKDFDAKPFMNLISQAEAALIPLKASSDMLKRDVSFGKFSGADLKSLRDFARKLTVRSDGLSFFYRIIDPLRERFPRTPAPSRPSTPPPYGGALMTASVSQPTTPTANTSARATSPVASRISLEPRRSSGLLHGNSSSDNVASESRSTSLHHKQHHHHLRLHVRTPSLFHEKLHLSSLHEVGMFESERYMDIEAALNIPRGDEYIETAVRLISESSSPLLGACADCLDSVISWLERNNTDRLAKFWHPFTTPNSGKESIKLLEETSQLLTDVLEKFKAEERLKVLEPYLSGDGALLLADYPPHRYLFQCFVYHFHLLEFAESLLDLLGKVQTLNEHRTFSRVWGPLIPWKSIMPLMTASKTEYEGDGPDDEDPDEVEGLQGKRSSSTYLNDTDRRDPDALPPSSMVQLLGTWIFGAVTSLSRGNLLYAIKAAMLTALMALPSVMGSSAEWAYAHRWVWAIIMSQLTLARFKGETTLNFFSRIVATFLGGLVGTVVWYVSTGDGHGNSYGLAATCAVFFPFLLFFRLYYPGPPVTTLLTSVTVGLVVGYSWKDTHNPTSGSPGYGWDVAWRRFLLVTIGVTSAFVFSFLPPATTIRKYQRLGQSTVIIELGTILCSIISLASSQEKARQPAIVKDLILIRSKIRRLRGQANHASYEYSLRGKWPASQYALIYNVLLEIAYLLSHLYTVVMRLDGVWAHAFLDRTRLLDPDFLGSVMSTLTMCSSSLRNGSPLPQITPAPLIDRFMKHRAGLDILPPTESEETDYGLPRTVTADILANEQYMCFCVGSTSVYGIITRLDRLILAVKELVGENFHVDGVEIPLAYRRGQ